ncbi:MAG: tetratricopeptide repeat protein [Bryobacter sp.]|nr:tetratricopeptide repeat protein [Bryobacter sp.]
MRNRITLTLAVCLLGTLTYSCSRDPKVVRQRYVDTGNKYYNNGKYREASIMYQRALQADMRFGEAHYRLGLSELKQGRPVNAIRSFQRAVELDPANMDAPAKLAELYLAAYASSPKRPQEYVKEIEDLTQKILAKNPNSYDGLRLKGYLALTANKLPDALAAFQQANSVKPDQPELILVLVQAMIANQQGAEAEKLANEFLAKRKDYAPLYDVLYAKNVRENLIEQGEQLLKRKADNNPNNSSFRLQLAAHYFVAKRLEDMKQSLQYLLDKPQVFPTANMLVGDFYFRIRDVGTALVYYQKGADAGKDDKAVYQKRMVEALVAQGRKTDASQLIEQVLKVDPKDNDAMAMRAALMLQSGSREQVQSAVNDLQTVVGRDPNNPVMRFNYARALIAKGDLDAAKIQLQEAINKRPDYLVPRLALAQVHMAKKEYPKALETATQILQFDPRNMPARLMKSSALIGMGDFRQSRAEIEDVLRANPGLSDAMFQLGIINMSEQKFKDAETVFRDFYQRAPTDVRALFGLSEALVSEGKTAEALTLMETELNKAPERNDIRMAYANIATRSEKLDIAEREFKKLIEKAPRSAELYLKLGEVYRRKGNTDAALAQFAKAKEVAPNDVLVYIQQALVLEARGEIDKAIPIYHQILKFDPDNPIALNNIAYMMAEQGQDLDTALTYATKAKQRMPTSAEVDDTLGWIYIKKNLSDNAIRIFRDLTAKYPDRAVYHYHLAMALYQKGDKPAALRSAQLALVKKPAKDEEQKIRDLISKCS